MAPSVYHLCAILGVLVGFLGLSHPAKTPFWHALSVPNIDIYILPILMFEDNGLEPYIQESTVLAHHEGHVENYRKKMNTALKQWRDADPKGIWHKKNLIEIVRNLDITPTVLRYDLTCNVGGYVNHVLYWAGLSGNPEGVDRVPTGKLLDDINREFKSFDKFKQRFTDKALGLFGSGYVWLCRVQTNPDALVIRTTVNQDSPIEYNLHPILVLDVWEHAYYLKHQFRRAAYVADWWMVVDWDLVAELDQWWADYDAKKANEAKEETEAKHRAYSEEIKKTSVETEDAKATPSGESDGEPAPPSESGGDATPSGESKGHSSEGTRDMEQEMEDLAKQVEELERMAAGEKQEL